MVKVPRKLFPSYVMIEMLSVREENELGLGYRVDSDAWYVIRNTNGVTGRRHPAPARALYRSAGGRRRQTHAADTQPE